MSAIDTQSENVAVRLRPRQKELADSILSPSSERIILHYAPDGMGRRTAISFTAARVFRENPKARVLILSKHGVLRDQWHSKFEEAGAPAFVVDRYRFREWSEKATEDAIWPKGAAVILTNQFAGMCDIKDSLARVDWDIVVLDEFQNFHNGELPNYVPARTDRVVILVHPAGLRESNGDIPTKITTINWSLADILKPKVTPLSFTRSELELVLFNMVKDLCTQTVETHEEAVFLFRSLRSSPAALETRLRHYVDLVKKSIDANKSASCVLDAIEDLPEDTKLTAFMSLVGERVVKATLPKICVVTDDISTVYYLAAEIEELETKLTLITNEMSQMERDTSASSFADSEGFLITTWDAIRGIEFGKVDEVILYDTQNFKNPRYSLNLGNINPLENVLPPIIHVQPQDNLEDTLLEQIREKFKGSDE